MWASLQDLGLCELSHLDLPAPIKHHVGHCTFQTILRAPTAMHARRSSGRPGYDTQQRDEWIGQMSLESTANLQQLPQMPAESRMTASCSRVVTTDHSHLHPLSERASASQVGVRASAACMDGGGVTSPLWLQQLGSRTHRISGRIASNGAPSALS